MNVRTIARTLGIATAFALSLSACSNNAPAPKPVTNADGGNVSIRTAEPTTSAAETSESSEPTGTSSSAPSAETSTTTKSSEPAAATTCTNNVTNAEFRLASTGSVDGYLTITNVGTKSCILPYDYPSMQFTGRSGSPAEGLIYTQGAAPTTEIITLAPGESANSDIEWQAEGGAECQAIVWALNLSVDQQSPPKSVSPDGGQTFSVCGNQVFVGAWNKP